MISEEHLKHWLGEITWQLNGILQQVDEEKVQMDGINVGSSGEAWVSFEYLQEKAGIIRKTLSCIEWDMEHDEK